MKQRREAGGLGERLWTLGDREWERIRAFFPRANGRKGFAQEIPSRKVFEAVLHRLRVGCPWRDLPKDYGFWHTIYTRLSRGGWRQGCLSGSPRRCKERSSRQASSTWL